MKSDWHAWALSRHGINSQVGYLLAVLPWAKYLTAVILNFFTYKLWPMKIIVG